MPEAKKGEFTLIYNGKNKAYPVALDRQQHGLLQQLVKCIPGTVKVLRQLTVKYEKKGK